MSTLSPLFEFANDGVRFYKAVMKRLAKVRPHLSLNAFCEYADVAFSTTHRWKLGSKPDAETIMKVEKAFKHFERKMVRDQVPGSSRAHADTSPA